MIKLTPIISTVAPTIKNALWIKPVDGGFCPYILFGGKWEALKMADTNETPDTADDKVQDLIGSVQDKKTANTINGAKAYAKSQAKSVVGSNSDTASDMTLHGLKKYIDEKLKELK